MSDDDEQVPDESAVEQAARRKKVVVEYLGSQRQAELDAKFATLQSIAGDATKAHSALVAQFVTDAPPKVNVTEWLGSDKALSMVKAASAPNVRAAEAAELTAERLEILVNAALESAADAGSRNRLVDKRESTMLRWTIAGVVLAAIAAVASILAILLG